MKLPPLNLNQRLELVLVCVGCAEMLDMTLGNNLRHFDSVIVATSPNDVKTQMVAKKHGIFTLITNAFHLNNAKFDKGAAHNETLKFLNFNEFVLFIDADIILHSHFRQYISQIPLNQDALYGADRIYVTKQIHVELMKQNRLMGPIAAGEWGFGHFQLFHMGSKFLQGKEKLCRSYPTPSEPFGFDDYLFREQFGSGHVFVDGVWNWDPIYQRKLSLPCFHLGEASAISKEQKIFQK